MGNIILYIYTTLDDFSQYFCQCLGLYFMPQNCLQKYHWCHLHSNSSSGQGWERGGVQPSSFAGGESEVWALLPKATQLGRGRPWSPDSRRLFFPLSLFLALIRRVCTEQLPTKKWSLSAI